jgi:hypothetical protein
MEIFITLCICCVILMMIAAWSSFDYPSPSQKTLPRRRPRVRVPAKVSVYEVKKN